MQNLEIQQLQQEYQPMKKERMVTKIWLMLQKKSLELLQVPWMIRKIEIQVQ